MTRNELTEILCNDELGMALLSKVNLSDIGINEKYATKRSSHMIVGDEYIVSVVLFPINHESKEDKESIQSSIEAFCILFERWTKAGYNYDADSDPFSSAAFQDFVKDIGYATADYILFETN